MNVRATVIFSVDIDMTSEDEVFAGVLTTLGEEKVKDHINGLHGFSNCEIEDVYAIREIEEEGDR